MKCYNLKVITYICIYIYIIIKDKSVFYVNDITQKTLICLSSRRKVMTAMKTYLHWLSVDPNGENFKLLFSILTYVKRNQEVHLRVERN